LREITKKRATRELAEDQARDAASAIAAKVVPLREAFSETLRELKSLFRSLLGEDSHLNKRDRARVRRFYARLLPDLADEPDNEPSGADNVDGEPSSHWGHEAPRADDGSESGYSASKPSEKNAGLLRSLFRKLAVALHPDKVQDEKERETLTRVMKEVTHAYESGDVARLVEIDRTWLAQTPVPDRESDIARRVADLLSANKELRRQLRALTAEVKEIKASVPGMQPRRRRGGPARSELEEMFEQMDQELGELRKLRDFAQRFADGEINITEFLLGPELLHAEDDDPFDQMLAEVLDAMASAPRERKPPDARRRSKR
jgi:hypothetical protein